MKTDYRIDQNTVVEAEEALKLAMLKADTVHLNSLLHDDLLFSIPNGTIATKEADISAYQAGDMLLKELHFANRQINIIDDTAVVSVQVEMKGSYLGAGLDGNYKFIRVWKSIDGHLQVIAGSSTLIP